MAGLRDMVSEYQDDLRNGISQPAVYKRKMKILKKLKIFLEK